MWSSPGTQEPGPGAREEALEEALEEEKEEAGERRRSRCRGERSSRS